MTDFGTNRKPVYDFLLVINTNLPSILHRFQVMADYMSNFRWRHGGLLYFTPSLGVIPFEYRHKYTTETTLCLKKNIPDVFSYNSQKHCRIFIIFSRNITEKVSNQKYYIFPPHLINVPALPCETENTEIIYRGVLPSQQNVNGYQTHCG